MLGSLTDLVLVCGYWFLLLSGVCAGAWAYVAWSDWRRSRRESRRPARSVLDHRDWRWPS